MNFNLQQLSEKADVPERSIRFYIQKKLLSPPKGVKRGAFYTEAHLAELSRIRQWRLAGLSLNAIEALSQTKLEAPISPVRPGAIEVRSHLIVAGGLELVVAPDRAGLTQTQLRQFFRAVQTAYAELVAGDQVVDP